MTVTVYVPAVDELTVKVELTTAPGVRATLTGDSEAVAPPPETEVASKSVPEKPRLLRLTDRPLEEPATRLTEVALGLTVKSFNTVNMMVRVWTTGPLVPVMLRLYEPARVAPVVEMTNVEVPDAPVVRVILVGLNGAARPVIDGGDNVKPTVPANPRLFREIMVVPEDPARNDTTGLDDMPKSATMNLTGTEWDTDPPIPATVTV